MPMYCRGIRGATTVAANTREAILAGTRELLLQIVAANNIQTEDIGSVIFTTTPDLTAEFPALAARELGWYDVALIGSQEIDVPGAMSRCIRILLHWNTPKLQHEIVHVYIRDAVKLRPERGHVLPASATEALALEGVSQ